MEDEKEPCKHELDRNVKVMQGFPTNDGIIVDVYCVHCGISTGVLILANEVEWDD